MKPKAILPFSAAALAACLLIAGIRSAKSAPVLAGTVNLQDTTPGSPQAGHINVTGTAKAGSFVGVGTALTGINAANIKFGLLSHARLPSNIPRYNQIGTWTISPIFGNATVPFEVSSTGLVTNLNADLLDGLQSTAFVRTTGTTNVGGPFGIGTASPKTLLHVFGGASGVSTPYSPSQIVMENSDHNYLSLLAPANKASGVIFGDPTSNIDGYIAFNASISRGLEIAVQGGIIRTVILGNGNVGIGYTNPNERLAVNGTISGLQKLFVIDHPLDPQNKVLRHASIESDALLNLYSGEIRLGGTGEAWVSMPDWFDALNEKVRYSLTALDQAMPDLHVKTRMAGGRFQIGGGLANGTVSWQITATRKDPAARLVPLVVEEDKAPSERGTYLYPKAYGVMPLVQAARLR